MYIYTSFLEISRHPGNWLPTSGPKKRRQTSKTTQKYQNWLKIKGKNDAKICSEILVAVFFRFFSILFILNITCPWKKCPFQLESALIKINQEVKVVFLREITHQKDMTINKKWNKPFIYCMCICLMSYVLNICFKDILFQGKAKQVLEIISPFP